MIIKRTSVISGIERQMDLDITPEQVAAWKAGGLIQNVFPSLTVDEREFIQTGSTPEEWDALFPMED